MLGAVTTKVPTGVIALLRRKGLPTAFYASSVLTLILVFGVLVGLYIPQGAEFQKVDVFRRLASWDGGWYFHIGQAGYSWNLAAGSTVQQDVAFFPAQGLIDKLLILIFGVNAVAASVAVSLALGIASIFS